MRATVFLALSLLSPLTAQGGDNLVDALHASRLSGFGKIMFVADDKKGGQLNQSTPGFGGRLGIETGNFRGFSFKGAVYTTQDLKLRSENPARCVPRHPPAHLSYELKLYLLQLTASEGIPTF